MSRVDHNSSQGEMSGTTAVFAQIANKSLAPIVISGLPKKDTNPLETDVLTPEASHAPLVLQQLEGVKIE